MKIVGLIAEYNPFHNGHQYHIEKAREITSADAVIVVMSGNFVQRGTPAIMPKHLRTEAALKGGASVVIELPVCYATGSAEYFAYGAVSIFEKLGCIDSICFGSECGNIEVLQDLAKIIHDEPKQYKESLSLYLRQGDSFPLARQKAMKDFLNSNVADSILGGPNNILGIEYLKALYRLDSKIKPYTIQRVGSHYHDDYLQKSYSSASAIRKAMSQTMELDEFDIENQMPTSCASLIKEAYGQRYPIYANDFSLLLKYKLLTENKKSLMEYADVSEELANRILNRLNDCVSFEQFCELLKTKEMTYARISRALIHILLDIKNEDLSEIAYARVLGFRDDDSEVLSQIKRHATISLVTKLPSVENLIANKTISSADNDGLYKTKETMLLQDINASNLYESVVTDKFGTAFVNEYKQKIVHL